MDTSNTKPIPTPVINLLKLNFSKHFNENDKFIFNIGNPKNHKELNLTYINLEKICFALGPGKYQKKNDVLYMEQRIPNQRDNERPIDFCFGINYSGTLKYIGFIENKTVKDTRIDTLKMEIKEAAKQIYDNYLAPLKGNQQHLFSEDIIHKKLNNFSISLCVYCPEVYLANKYNFNNYCNDKESAAIQKMQKYGFVMLTIFINTDEIKSPQALQAKFDYFFINQNSKTSSHALVVPVVVSFSGYIRKDVFDDNFNIIMTTTLEQLDNIPYFNVNTSSNITNTRNLSVSNNKLKNGLITSLVLNFKNLKEVGRAETYRSLGSKPREMSFFIPQTIIFLNENKDNIEENKMSQKAYYLSSNMTLIDGQHSSHEYSSIVEDMNKYNHFNEEYEKIIVSIFGKQLVEYKEFKKFALDHHIDLSIKGFSKEATAQLAAKNQNNIKKQSQNEITINNNRKKILIISKEFNSKSDCPFKIDVNKGAWSNSDLNEEAVNIVAPDYLTNVYGVWSQRDSFFDDEHKVNTLLGKNNSPANSLTNNNFEAAINWYFNIDEDMEKLSHSIRRLIEELHKQENFEDDNNTDETMEDLVIKYNKLADQFLKLVIKLDSKLSLKNNELLKDYLTTFKTAFREQNEGEMLKRLEMSKDLIDGMHPTYENRINNAMLLFIKSYEFSNTYTGSFLKEKKIDRFYYLFNFINLFLRLKINKDFPNSKFPLDHINEKLIDNELKEISNRFSRVEDYLKASNTTLKELNFGGAKNMDVALKKILFRD